MRRPVAAALAAAALAPALGAAPALAGDPILPLEEVRPGMLGEARTVVRGTEVVTFPLRVFDVQQLSDAPGGALILARAEGPLMERTGGVAEGMSGSPVYVTGADGVPRVIGAVAYGAGDEANVVTGITPIEQMLASASGRRLLERPAGARAVRRVRLVADRRAARRLAARDPGRIGLYPLARWTAAGVSRPLVGPLAARLRREGIRLNAIAGRIERPPAPLVPGATMSVLIAGGDIAIGGIGTVTYVDGPRVLGFGHPFLGVGRARLLLGDGYVFDVIAAPIRGESYKLAEPGRVQGAIVADRSDGVTGVLGPAPGIPAVSRARNADRGTAATVRAVLAPDERAAPIAAALLEAEPLARVTDGAARGTVRLRVRIASPALRRPIVIADAYAAAGDVSASGGERVGALVGALTQNGVRSLPLGSVRIDQTVTGEVRAARITGARVVPLRARAGARVTLLVRVVPWRAAPRILRVPVRLPPGLPPGRASLRVVPNGSEGFDATPASLDAGVGEAASGPAARRLARRIEAGAAGRRGTRAERVAGAARSLAARRNDAVRVLLPGEAEGDRAAGRVVPTPLIPYAGRAGVVVTVVRPGRARAGGGG